MSVIFWEGPIVLNSAQVSTLWYGCAHLKRPARRKHFFLVPFLTAPSSTYPLPCLQVLRVVLGHVAHITFGFVAAQLSTCVFLYAYMLDMWPEALRSRPLKDGLSRSYCVKHIFSASVKHRHTFWGGASYSGRSTLHRFNLPLTRTQKRTHTALHNHLLVRSTWFDHDQTRFELRASSYSICAWFTSGFNDARAGLRSLYIDPWESRKL
jgi:hypothetical protein